MVHTKPDMRIYLKVSSVSSQLSSTMPVAMCVYHAHHRWHSAHAHRHLVRWESTGHRAVCTTWFCHLTWSHELLGVVTRECLHDTTLSRDFMLCLVSKQCFVTDGCQCKYEGGAFQVIWALFWTKNKPRMKKRLRSCSSWLCCCSDHFHILHKPPHLLSLAIVLFMSLRPAWILSALDIKVSVASGPTGIFKVLTLNDPVVTKRTTRGEQKPVGNLTTGLKLCRVWTVLLLLQKQKIQYDKHWCIISSITAVSCGCNLAG